MGKLYTLDGKLLVETPEIRIGDKCYAVDNRKKTLDRITKLMQQDGTDMERMDEAMEQALGKAAVRELNVAEMPWPAYEKLFELVMAAMTGEEPEAVADRFQEEKNKAAK